MLSLRPNSRVCHGLLHACGAVVALLVMIAGAGAHRAIAARHEWVKQQQVQASDLLARAAEVCEAQKSEQRRLQSVQQEAGTLRARLPDSVQDTQFLQQVSELARQSDVTLGDFRPGTLAKFPSHSELEVKLHGEGAYEPVCRFLAGLQRLGRAYRITQFNLTSSASQDVRCRLEVELRLAFGFHPGNTAGEGQP
jgi:Tfp pilus assembly protein PilO